MVRELLDSVMRIISRSQAYKRCFMDDGKITPDADIVLRDLAKFCRANQPTTVISPVSRTVDPIASGIAEGRREVWLRLMWHLKINEADLINVKEDDYE